MLLWPCCPSPTIVSTARFFRNDHWVCVPKGKHLKKLILFLCLTWRWASVFIAAVLNETTSSGKVKNQGCKNTTSLLKTVVSYNKPHWPDGWALRFLWGSFMQCLPGPLSFSSSSFFTNPCSHIFVLQRCTGTSSINAFIAGDRWLASLKIVHDSSQVHV